MPALRSFSSYTNAAPVSPNTWIDNQKTVTRALTFPCNLLNMDGTTDATSGYFQVFDLAVAPTTAVTVPLKSMAILQAGPLPELLPALGPLLFAKGLFVAISSTEAVYTAQASNFDVWGEVEEWEGQVLDSISTAGDLSTGRDTLTVWSDSQSVPAPKKLLQIDAVNNTGAAAYLQLFATAPTTGVSVPIIGGQWSLPNTTQKTLRFGSWGMTPTSTDNDALVVRRGCLLAVSTTVNLYTRPSSTNLNYIRAYYKSSLV